MWGCASVMRKAIVGIEGSSSVVRARAACRKHAHGSVHATAGHMLACAEQHEVR